MIGSAGVDASPVEGRRMIERPGAERRSMAEKSFAEALERRRQIEITTIGRRTGRRITTPVWFAVRGDTLYLLPVNGSDTNWYKNLLKDPTIRILAGKAERTTTATPISDPATIDEVLEAFRDRYGDLEAYYPKTDVAVEVPAR
jgi:deazaflavin-dependent oxidoreductase (nitroreductase family)